MKAFFIAWPVYAVFVGDVAINIIAVAAIWITSQFSSALPPIDDGWSVDIATLRDDWSSVTRLRISEAIPMAQIPLQAESRRQAWLHFYDGELVHLQSLAVLSPLEEDQFIKLLEPYQLRSLRLIHLGPLTEGGARILERQPLEELHVISNDLSLWTANRLPTTLRRLWIQYDPPEELDPARSHLEMLLNLPLLESVSIKLRTEPDGRARLADLVVLQQMKSLRRLHLGLGYPHNDAVLMRELEAVLPGVVIRPDSYRSSRVALAAVIFVSSLMSLLAILWVLSHLFEMSALQPGFARCQSKAALILLVGWAGFHGVILLIARCDWFAAGVWAGFAIAVTSVALLGRAPLPTWYRSGVIIYLIILLYPFICLFWWFSPEVDWMLAGFRPDFLCVLLGWELAGLLIHQRFFERLPRRMIACSDGPPRSTAWDATVQARWWPASQPRRQPMRIDAPSPSVATPAVAQPTALESGEFWCRSQPRRLAAAVNCPAGEPGRQLLLWRAIPPFEAWEFATFFGIPTIAGYFVMGFITDLVLPSSAYRNSVQFYSFLAMAVMLIMCGAPTVVLILVRPFFARHLLMALNRRDWVRIVFRDTAINFVPAIIAAVIAVIFYAWFAPSRLWSAPQVALTAAAGLACVYSNSLLALSTSKISNFIATAAWQTLVFILCLAPLPLLLLIMDSIGILSDASISTTWPPVWWVPMFVNAAIIYQSARDRWLTCELD